MCLLFRVACPVGPKTSPSLCASAASSLSSLRNHAGHHCLEDQSLYTRRYPLSPHTGTGCPPLSTNFHACFVCTSRAQEKLHRTWDSSTEVSPRPVVPAIVWTGALRTTPLDAGPLSITDPDPVLWSTHCSTVRSPTLNSRESVSKHTDMGGDTLRRSAGQWVGGWAKTEKLPKHWRRKQKLRRGTTSVCTSRAQEKLHRTWVFILR